MNLAQIWLILILLKYGFDNWSGASLPVSMDHEFPERNCGAYRHSGVVLTAVNFLGECPGACD